MKECTFKRQGAQGDMLLTAVDVIPKGFTAQKAKGEVHIVTHSETGHHHVVDSTHVDLFTAANESFVSYLHVKKPTALRHLRDFDIHETIQLEPGIFRINRQREYTPDGFRQVQD